MYYQGQKKRIGKKSAIEKGAKDSIGKKSTIENCEAYSQTGMYLTIMIHFFFFFQEGDLFERDGASSKTYDLLQNEIFVNKSFSKKSTY